MGKMILVTGGTRSGKSSFAESLCSDEGSKVLYVATAEPLDEEMEDRILKHRHRRPDYWKTVEVYEKLGELGNRLNDSSTVMLDSLTMYVNNMIFHSGVDAQSATMSTINRLEEDLLKDLQYFIDGVRQSNKRLVIVTDELGMGIVPENRLTRVYRDMVGKINQAVAGLSDEVFVVISGIPVKIKG